MKSISELQEAYARAAIALTRAREAWDAARKETDRLGGVISKVTEARNVARSDLLNAIEVAASTGPKTYQESLANKDGQALSPPAAERTASGDLAFVVGRKYRLRDEIAPESSVVYRAISVGWNGFDALLVPVEVEFVKAMAEAKLVPLSDRALYAESL